MIADFFLLMKNELTLTAIIFIILGMKIAGSSTTGTEDNKRLLNIINVLLVINFLFGLFFNVEGRAFGDMFRVSQLITFEKSILSLGTMLVSFTAYDWLKSHKHVAEFYILLLSTLLGMNFMISSDNLMMFYLGLELSTIPLAAMAGFNLSQRRSSEAAMKMIMMSAFASGLLLFGISFLYGTTGTLSLDLLPEKLGRDPLQLFSLVLVFAGFGFKISAVPFHLWTADVYEGSPSSVTAYLSVISKGSVLFVMTSVLYNAFRPLQTEWYQLLFVLAVATIIIGNLFAMRQPNIKRLLAFSSIAQVGFIMVGMSGQSVDGAASVIYFVLVYLFSNLAAFGVITIVTAQTGKETIDDYFGFYKNNPMLTWILALALFSLAGIPPAAGFFGKFFLLLAGAAKGNYVLIIIAALNMVIALYYYLFVVKVMFTSKHHDEPIRKIEVGALPMAGLVICVTGILVAGIYGDVYGFVHSLVK